ncbi:MULTISPECIES: helix-turn-helix domain-containing protein [unclassified Fusibacter]|uniref:helix-turn-helix domain-containing protein n=1 Tax=unclassified Fusibacter TaxID=2624464 RepID=UPI001010C879|nr:MULTISPECIES: helix-turn-helix transcriptional regulator [unclassified Fusibacter]MCK8060211.1 helix-turn-helix domain-containing protein [Fusibacter sp. A2]NPE22351.1 helix-turn-helix transcriptional regulator [Fusibacter sp. A1]RXV61124.1 XRE family transcriptional regulator [Fusibacter sp. A1]
MFNDLNIASVIADHRRAKGVTQEQLAEYIGVSKASVSKWEKGHSYPDITFLPQLASYFDISIDDLMGYTPQLTKESIKALYNKLCTDFANKSFEEVWPQCQDIIKKYYSCYPLLMQMAVLLCNHFMLAMDQSTQSEVLQQAIDLCKRIELESGDIRLSKEAVSLAATCYLLKGEPQNTLSLLGETIRPLLQDDAAIAQAYIMLGQAKEADKVIQISIYQHMLILISSCTTLLHINDEKFEEILNRIMILATAFQLDYLHPNSMLIVYLTAAQAYCTKGRYADALSYLEKYKDVCITHFFPFSLRGDEFFDEIEDWFAEFALGEGPPRSEAVIKQSMIDSLKLNPIFDVLKDDPHYIKLLKSLATHLGGNPHD